MVRCTGEDGFSLTELLVVIVILGMVTATVFGVYQISQTIYTRQVSLEEAQLGARAGLDRMANELRLIGGYVTGATGAPAAISAATATSITFLADIDADTASGSAETTSTGTTNPGTSVVVSGNADKFNVYSSDTSKNDYLYIGNGVFRELRQVSSVDTTTQTITLATALTNTYPAGSIARSVETVTYTFNDASGSPANTITRTLGGISAETMVENVKSLTLTYYDSTGTSTTTVASIREIKISITTNGSDGSSRTMTSRVKVRNLS